MTGEAEIRATSAEPPRATIALVMIVKDEAHVVTEAFDSVLEFIDTWCIVDTGSTDALAMYLSTRGAEIRDTMHANTLMRRNGTPQDIADAVLFFASPAACWITGKLLEVDGGAAENIVPKAIADLAP